MNKAKLTEKFSQLLNEIENLKDHDDFYTYEKEFVNAYEEFGRKKKDQNELWKSRFTP